ncbi:glycosyltransferase family 25 protein [Mycobacteroides abscessus]|uniref:glycosyltransferase family 25 protein n=1 Tax=Mycobacteroides abscessus TaxID=36809 RepID=UPI000929C3A7|nr:glycosyltransferase family 25 protein [Mycobacteroides abscessus]DAZ90334.1 TPA_asm: hypothetical protein PROPHIFSQJ01-1_48 [Mycobacterium phage prophiFSQJ01-1]SII41086.1 Bacteriophage protein [Mycobacteroides abscessus subsp. abscessus]SIK14104.1 Bacteriophage protein [Mycobacteroides abscessus subsp. abscessus]SIN25445.1 Bacteriophage protein [Mycobacteroides abscessus subsp. abscessus]SLI51492.1 Bacteriophage protein [Mycobacteroides abscessus subsp. abscessus]
MNINIGIVGHVDRVEETQALAEQVNASTVAIDDGSLGCEANHQRVWQMLTIGDSDWSVVLEDDAQPVEGFRQQLESALTVAPTSVVSLYLGKGRPEFAQTELRKFAKAYPPEKDYAPCWFVSEVLLHAVGIAMRTELIPEMLEHLRQPPAVFLAQDEAIGHWARHRGHSIGYTWPSLVNHADTPTVIDEHPDGVPRGPRVIDGQIVVTPRRGWQVGTRDTWTHHHVELALRRPHVHR